MGFEANSSFLHFVGPFNRVEPRVGLIQEYVLRIVGGHPRKTEQPNYNPIAPVESQLY